MKKIIQVLFIIIFAILLSGAVSYAFVGLHDGTTSRGVSVEMTYGGGGAAWRRQ